MESLTEMDAAERARYLEVFAWICWDYLLPYSQGCSKDHRGCVIVAWDDVVARVTHFERVLSKTKESASKDSAPFLDRDPDPGPCKLRFLDLSCCGASVANAVGSYDVEAGIVLAGANAELVARMQAAGAGAPVLLDKQTQVQWRHFHARPESPYGVEVDHDLVKRQVQLERMLDAHWLRVARTAWEGFSAGGPCVVLVDTKTEMTVPEMVYWQPDDEELQRLMGSYDPHREVVVVLVERIGENWGDARGLIAMAVCRKPHPCAANEPEPLGAAPN